jgi:peptidoglycan hydrolase-like protein with peptidoglycan-binding domain
VRVGFQVYPTLVRGASRGPQVRALQCLLRERGHYRGPLHGVYGARTVAAARAWQASRGQPVSDTFTRGHWVALLSHGRTPVLKLGSGGPVVRRAKRALNAAMDGGLVTHGVFDAAADRAVRGYQRRVGIRASGVVNTATWAALQAGRS